MPRQHLDALERGYGAFNHGSLDEAKDTFADDIEWGTTGAWPGMEDTYRGREGVQAWADTVRGEWESFEVSLTEVLRDQENAIAVVELLRGRGRESGAEAEMRVYAVYWFDEVGRLSKRRAFTTAEEALAALE
jgi:ketosteroid isomerase-like protein